MDKQISVTFTKRGPSWLPDPGTELPDEMSGAFGMPGLFIGMGNILFANGSAEIAGNTYIFNGQSVQFAPYPGMAGVHYRQLNAEELEKISGIAAAPPPPLPSVPVEVALTSAKTPLELADANWERMVPRWNAFRQGNRDALTNEQVARYQTLKLHRKAPGRWRAGAPRAKLNAALQISLLALQERVEAWEAFLDRYDEYGPTEAKFSELNGGVDVDSYEERDLPGGGTARVSRREVYENDLRIYNSFRNEIASEVREAKERLREFEVGEQTTDLVDNLVDEVLAAGQSIGLTAHDDWNDRDDGAVWFTDGDGKYYFFSLYYFAEHRFGQDAQSVVNELQVVDRSRAVQFVDLGMSAIEPIRVIDLDSLGRRTFHSNPSLCERIGAYLNITDDVYPEGDNPFSG